MGRRRLLARGRRGAAAGAEVPIAGDDAEVFRGEEAEQAGREVESAVGATGALLKSG